MGDLVAQIKEWVKERPYLEEVARLHEALAAAVAEDSTAPASEASAAGIDRSKVAAELEKGIPLLRAVELEQPYSLHAAQLLEKITGLLVEARPTEEIKHRALQAQKAFQEQAGLAEKMISEVWKTGALQQGKEELGETDEGLLLFLAWSALSSALEPLQKQLAELLEELNWRRGYCPLCGQLPSMGYLFHEERGKGQGRRRDLICGCCRMRWRYKRIGCPYCGNLEQDQLKIIGLDDEPDFRIDTCDHCKSYLKTYMGEGREKVALADWSTLHLDLVAKKKDFKRAGYQMYAL